MVSNTSPVGSTVSRTRVRRTAPLELVRRLYHFWFCRVVDFRRAFFRLRQFVLYLRDWRRYAQMPGAESLRFGDSYPCLEDRTAHTCIDTHYFYQAVWAAERIVQHKPSRHVDVGSNVGFVGQLCAFLPVVFVDIRPLRARLPRLVCLSGSLLDLPFTTAAVESLSCLHVAEHVGLGRYGDPLNPAGTRLACGELARVLAPGGHLFFSIPVGRPRVCFNAHRIHSPTQILRYFEGLTLVEFSAVDDQGELLMDIRPDQMEGAEYACGLFWLRRA